MSVIQTTFKKNSPTVAPPPPITYTPPNYNPFYGGGGGGGGGGFWWFGGGFSGGGGSPGGGGTYTTNGFLKLTLSYDSLKEVDLGYPYPYKNSPITVNLYDIARVANPTGIDINFQIIGNVIYGRHFSLEPLDSITAARFRFNPVTNTGSAFIPYNYTGVRFNLIPLFEYAKGGDKNFSIKVLPGLGYTVDPSYTSRNISVQDYKYTYKALHLPFTNATQYDDVATNKIVNSYGAIISNDILDPFGNDTGNLKLDGTNWVEVNKSVDFNFSNIVQDSYNRETNITFWYYPTSFPNHSVYPLDYAWGLLDTRSSREYRKPTPGGWNLLGNNNSGQLLWSEGANNNAYTVTPLDRVLILNQWNFIRIFRDWSTTALYINTNRPVVRANPLISNINTDNLLIGRAADIDIYKGSSASGYMSDFVVTLGWKDKLPVIPLTKQSFTGYNPPPFRLVQSRFKPIFKSSRLYRAYKHKSKLIITTKQEARYNTKFVFVNTILSSRYNSQNYISTYNSTLYKSLNILSYQKITPNYKLFNYINKTELSVPFNSYGIINEPKFVFPYENNVIVNNVNVPALYKNNVKINSIICGVYIDSIANNDPISLVKYKGFKLDLDTNISKYRNLAKVLSLISIALYNPSYKDINLIKPFYLSKNNVRQPLINSKYKTYNIVRKTYNPTFYNANTKYNTTTGFTYPYLLNVSNSFSLRLFEASNNISNFINSPYLSDTKLLSNLSIFKFNTKENTFIKNKTLYSNDIFIKNILKPVFNYTTKIVNTYSTNTFKDFLKLTSRQYIQYKVNYTNSRYLNDIYKRYLNITINKPVEALFKNNIIDTKDVIASSITYITDTNYKNTNPSTIQINEKSTYLNPGTIEILEKRVYLSTSNQIKMLFNERAYTYTSIEKNTSKESGYASSVVINVTLN